MLNVAVAPLVLNPPGFDVAVVLPISRHAIARVTTIAIVRVATIIAAVISSRCQGPECEPAG
jgi:hypothetical protein